MCCHKTIIATIIAYLSFTFYCRHQISSHISHLTSHISHLTSHISHLTSHISAESKRKALFYQQLEPETYLEPSRTSTFFGGNS